MTTPEKEVEHKLPPRELRNKPIPLSHAEDASRRQLLCCSAPMYQQSKCKTQQVRGAAMCKEIYK